MKSVFLLPITVVLALSSIFTPALAQQVPVDPIITIYADKAPAGSTRTAQNLHVYHRDSTYPLLFAIVSTGRENETEQATSGVQTDSITPTGEFGITRMVIDHESNLWDGAPMPYAIFFHKGYAFHGVYEGYYSKLGDRASGGCVRLALYMARQLWDIVESYGPENVKVVIYDSSLGQMPRAYFH